MREIVLSGGMVAQVDDCDFENLSRRNWSARWSPKAKAWYAYDCSGQAMHREILGLQKGDPRQGDHIEPEETLNNQRYNLRIATRANNQANRRKNSNNKSGYKGVSWHTKRRVWHASIGVNGRNVFIGRFKTAEDAYAAYCEAAMRLHGEFARMA